VWLKDQQEAQENGISLVSADFCSFWNDSKNCGQHRSPQ